MMYKILSLVAMVAGLSACAHSAYVPNTPHQIPKVAGKRWGGKVGLDFSSAAEVPLFVDSNTVPPTRATTGTIGTISGGGTALVAALGIFEPVDIYTTGGFGVRWQFLGLESGILATDTLWKATVFAGSIGGRETTTTYNQTKMNTRMTGSEYGASVGYLATPDMLLYSTYVLRGGKGTTKVTYTANATVFDYEDKFDLSSLVFGLNFGTEWYFNFEIGASSVKWENSSSGDAFASSIGFGYQW